MTALLPSVGQSCDRHALHTRRAHAATGLRGGVETLSLAERLWLGVAGAKASAVKTDAEQTIALVPHGAPGKPHHADVAAREPGLVVTLA